MGNKSEMQRAERIKKDCEIVKIYIHKVGYITKEIATEIGILNYEDVMRLLNSQHCLEWMKAGDLFMLYYANYISCVDCGKFTVYSLDSGDCESCHSFQSGVGESTRACASSHAHRTITNLIDISYGDFEELTWTEELH